MIVTMTRALCLKCGSIKIGALCPCSKCHAGSTGNHAVDITFSDHCIVVDSLKQLGTVITAINKRSHDPNLCQMAFLHYVATSHPSILSIGMSDEQAAMCQQLIDKAPLPPVKITKVRPRKQRQRAPNAAYEGPAIRWWLILPLIIFSAGIVYFLFREIPLGISFTEPADNAVLTVMVAAVIYVALKIRHPPSVKKRRQDIGRSNPFRLF